MIIALVIMASITSLVLPLLLSNKSFQEAESRRHALLLSSICYQAHKAGVDFIKPGELGGTLQNLLVGGSASNGRRYQAVGMTHRDVEAASEHLHLRDGKLLYLPSNL